MIVIFCALIRMFENSKEPKLSEENETDSKVSALHEYRRNPENSHHFFFSKSNFHTCAFVEASLIKPLVTFFTLPVSYQTAVFQC